MLYPPFMRTIPSPTTGKQSPPWYPWYPWPLMRRSRAGAQARAEQPGRAQAQVEQSQSVHVSGQRELAALTGDALRLRSLTCFSTGCCFLSTDTQRRDWPHHLGTRCQ